MIYYLNVYPNDIWGDGGRIYSTPHGSREDADMYAAGHRLYCVKVTLK